MDIIAETNRLFVTKLHDSDTDSLFRLTGDNRVMTYFPKVLSYVETTQMMKKILQHYKKYGYCFWKLTRREDNEFVGIAGVLHQIIDSNEEMEMSYRILPGCWNRGYATEAVTGIKMYADKQWYPKRLISLIHTQNRASQRVAEKVGAIRTRQTPFLGTMHDVCLYL